MPSFTCGACEERYDEAAWQGLVVIDRLEPRDVRRFVSIWPDDVCVEVRHCGRCGQAIAARRPGGP